MKAEQMNQTMVTPTIANLPFGLSIIAAAIKASGKHWATFFTVEYSDGTRGVLVGSSGVRVTAEQYDLIRRACPPPEGPSQEQLAIWKLQRRAGRDD